MTVRRNKPSDEKRKRKRHALRMFSTACKKKNEEETDHFDDLSSAFPLCGGEVVGIKCFCGEKITRIHINNLDNRMYDILKNIVHSKGKTICRNFIAL